MVAALTLLLLYTAAKGARLSKRPGAPETRDRALGTVLTAVGALVANVGAASLIVLLRNGLIGGILYLQVEFLLVFVGFAAVYYGIETVLMATLASNRISRLPRRKAELRILLSSAYALAVGVSAMYLLNPATYSTSYSGATQHVAQQTVFWLPVFLTLSVGILTLLPASLKSKEVSVRKHASWFVLFAAFVLIGLLRKATTIPSSGDPLIDLLVAFVPLTLGALRLLQSSRTLDFMSSRP